MAKAGKKAGEGKASIVLRKEEVIEGGHHGGAWKVAYADFVTAMMAFFLLMWLLNATTEEQRKGLADYFSPRNVLAQSQSGAGQPFAGRTPFSDGAYVSDKGAAQVVQGKAPPPPDVEPDEADTPATQPFTGTLEHPVDTQARQAAGPADAQGSGRGGVRRQLPGTAPPAASRDPAEDLREAEERARAERQEREAFERAAEQIRQEIRNDPRLAALARQLTIDMTPEGLRIQLLDEDRQPMFATGSVAMNDRARLLLQKVAPVLQRLPEGVSITGHTDAAPYRGSDRSNWELSADRANATRRLLVESGLPEERIRNVAGHADRDPLLPADPMAAANRRIAIVVLRSAGPAAAPAEAPHAPPPVTGTRAASPAARR